MRDSCKTDVVLDCDSGETEPMMIKMSLRKSRIDQDDGRPLL